MIRFLIFSWCFVLPLTLPLSPPHSPFYHFARSCFCIVEAESQQTRRNEKNDLKFEYTIKSTWMRTRTANCEIVETCTFSLAPTRQCDKMSECGALQFAASGNTYRPSEIRLCMFRLRSNQQCSTRICDVALAPSYFFFFVSVAWWAERNLILNFYLHMKRKRNRISSFHLTIAVSDCECTVRYALQYVQSSPKPTAQQTKCEISKFEY